MTVVDWLKLDHNLKQIAELLTINGGTAEVRQVGVISQTDKNRYGRFGLTVDEAFHLTYLRGVMDGLANAHGQANAHMEEALRLIKQEASGISVLIASPKEIKILLGDSHVHNQRQG